MRYSILGFNQEEVLKLRKTITKDIRGEIKQIELRLDVTDLLIINHLADFPNRKKVTKIILDDKIFFWVSYNTIIEELPIIDIKKQALSDRLAKMVELGILERRIQTCGSSANMTFFRISEAYENLKYKEGYSSQTQGVSYSTTTPYGSQTQDVNNIVDNNIVDIEKEDTNVSKKEQLDYESILSAWNKIAYDVESVSKVKSLTDSRKKQIKTLISKCKTSVDEITKLINTIPYADDWVLGKGDKGWAINFDFLMKNTSNWYVRALEGEMHRKNRYEFDKIMNGECLSLHTENSDTPKFQF